MIIMLPILVLCLINCAMNGGSAQPRQLLNSPVGKELADAQAVLIPVQSNNSPFPFKLPGLGQRGIAEFDPGQRALIDRVNGYLTSVQTLVGDFVQVNSNGHRSDGKIYLQKPGKVKFVYKPPSPTELVSDGTSVVVRDLKLNTQDVYPVSQTPLRFLLANRIDLLRD